MHLSSASPRGDPGLIWGNTGTLQQISALVVGKIDCSLDRWQDGGGEEEGSFKIHCFFVYQTDHPSQICTYLWA